MEIFEDVGGCVLIGIVVAVIVAAVLCVLVLVVGVSLTDWLTP